MIWWLNFSRSARRSTHSNEVRAITATPCRLSCLFNTSTCHTFSGGRVGESGYHHLGESTPGRPSVAFYAVCAPHSIVYRVSFAVSTPSVNTTISRYFLSLSPSPLKISEHSTLNTQLFTHEVSTLVHEMGRAMHCVCVTRLFVLACHELILKSNF